MKYDFCCIGSALVDITFQIDNDFVLKNEDRGIPKGAMTLIEKEDQINIIDELKNLGSKIIFDELFKPSVTRKRF